MIKWQKIIIGKLRKMRNIHGSDMGTTRDSGRGSARDMGSALFLDLPLDTIFLGHEKANVEEFSRRLNFN